MKKLVVALVSIFAAFSLHAQVSITAKDFVNSFCKGFDELHDKIPVIKQKLENNDMLGIIQELQTITNMGYFLSHDFSNDIVYIVKYNKNI